MSRVLLVIACIATLVYAGDDTPGSAVRTPSSPAPVEESGLRQLLSVRRVFIDRLTGGETAAQMRDILMSSLQGTKLFVITENQDRADVTLKGAAEDLVFNETHGSSEGVNARANAGTGRQSGSTRGSYAGFGFGESDSEHSTERRHEAIA